MEVKVGDYIRTIDGIKRIVKINTGFDKTYYGQYILDKPYKGSYSIAEKNILKHSTNLIDLIEVGDYVNGYPVIDVYEDHICVIDFGMSEDIYESDINLIVTKEQFESVQYKVGE